MKFRKLPRQAYLLRCLVYDPITGELRWRPRPLKHFSSYRSFCSWNGKFAGKRAFCTRGHQRYLHGRLDWIIYFTNRIVWRMVTGQDPKEKEVEHKNRNEGDNRWVNLRLALHHENGANRSVPSNNTSGHVGVSFDRTHKKWKAYLRKKGKRISLGTFNKKCDAVAARQAGAKKYFGEFAP